MIESDFIKNITIIGIGQIGGSLALAFRKYLKHSYITGWDINNELLSKAFMLNKVASSIEDSCKNADVIWLATPVDSIIKLIPKIADLKPNALICDVGSTKKMIIKTANSINKNFRFVSTHPLAGTEKNGPDSWNDSLFKNKNFFIIPTKNSNKNDIMLIQNLIKRIKANPVTINAAQHDKILAYTSHLPYLIANALKITCEKLNMKDKHLFEGPAYLSMTRLSKCPISVMEPIINTNKKNIINALDAFLQELKNISTQSF